MAHNKCIEKYINKNNTLCDCIIDDIEELKYTRKQIRKMEKEIAILTKANVS